jgi:REP element-mobilizing transposase RayT
MVRGIEQRTIFADDDDRDDLAVRLSRIVPESGATCFAWAFMPNHVHLVVRSGTDSVSRLMARVGTGYARRFNERHQRVGHLFQNRFQSRIVSDDADLLCVIRYVHLNPVAAGIVGTLGALAHYPWTGHAGLSGGLEPRLFHATSEALALLGSSLREARDHLRALMQVGIEAQEARDELHGRRDSSPGASAPRADLATLLEVEDAICKRFRIEPLALRSRARPRELSRARAAFAAEAVQRGVPLVQVASWLRVSRSAVTLSLRNLRNRGRS